MKKTYKIKITVSGEKTFEKKTSSLNRIKNIINSELCDESGAMSQFYYFNNYHIFINDKEINFYDNIDLLKEELEE